MSSISGVIPNVIGGISQQPPAARLENAAEDLQNAIPSVVSGLRKRPPIQVIDNIMATPSENVSFFMLDRPDKEVKFVIIESGHVRVFAKDGSEEPVSMTADSISYLTESNPEASFGFLGIADSVFIYNKNKVVTKTAIADTRDAPTDQITMVIENSAAGADYLLRITDGTDVVSGNMTTNSTTPEDVSEIATDLRDDAQADPDYATLGVSISRRDNLIFMTGCDAAGITSDYRNEPGSLTRMYRSTVADFTKLPPEEINGRIVKVDPSGGAEADDHYWVKYDQSERVWQETFGTDAQEEIDDTTMPYLLTDDGDGTWTFESYTWDSRNVGDDDTNETPSFVGYKIRQMFTSSNRLILLADENMIASEVDNYGNFYRTTCTTLIDSDRIDAAALSADARIAQLNYAIDFDDALLLFSDKTQFRLDNSEGLSPGSINLKSTTAFNASKGVNPVKAGTNVLFVDDQNNSAWADVREYLVDNVIGVNTSEVITKQVPELIPSGTHHIISNDSQGMVLFFGTTNRNQAFLYNYYFSDNRRIQSAWSYWYDGDGKFLNGAFDGNLLYLLMDREGELYLTKMELQETVTGDVEGLEIMLDYRAAETQCTVSLNGADTDIILPYDLLADDDYVVVLTVDGSDTAGTAYPADSINTTTNTVTIEGVDLTSDTFFVGKTYKFRYEMSPIYLRDQNKVPIQDGRLQIRWISLLFHQTSYFTVDVDIPGRDTYTKTMTGRLMGDLANIIGDVAVIDGEYRVPVKSEASKVSITIENDSAFNCRFSSIEWEGVWRPRTKRISR